MHGFAKHFITFAMSLINSVIQEQECSFIYYMTLKLLGNFVFWLENAKIFPYTHDILWPSFYNITKMKTTRGLSNSIHDVISLPDTSYDKWIC